MSLETNFTQRRLSYQGDAGLGAIPMCTARGRSPPDCDAPGSDPRSHLRRLRRWSSCLLSWPLRRWALQQDVCTPHSAGSHLGSGFRLLPCPRGLASWDVSSIATTPSTRNRPKVHPHQALSKNYQGCLFSHWAASHASLRGAKTQKGVLADRRQQNSLCSKARTCPDSPLNAVATRVRLFRGHRL